MGRVSAGLLLALLRCLFFWGDSRVSLPLGFGAVISRFSAGVFCVFFFSLLLCERVLFLTEAFDSFGSQVSLSDVVALWDESRFSLGPLSRLDLRVTLVMWSPFGMSLGFA